MQLRTAVYGRVDDYAARVGFEGVLFGLPYAGPIIVLFCLARIMEQFLMPRLPY